MITRAKLFSYFRFALFMSFGIILFIYIFNSQQAVYYKQCMEKAIPGQDCSLWTKLFTDIKQLDRWLMSLVGLCFILSNVIRAQRWLMMLKPMGIHAHLWEVYWSVHLGYFANLALPRMGELARAGTLARRVNAPFEKMLGTIVTDRIFDVLVLLLFIFIGFVLQTQILYEFLSTQANVSIWQLMGIGLVGLAGICVLIFLFKTDRFYHPVIERLKNKLAGFKIGILSALHTGQPFLMIFYSLSIWMLYYTMTILGLKAFAPTAHIGLAAGLVVFVIGSLGMVVPTPGGIGPFHYLTMSALGIYGINSIDGFSYANLSFIVVQVITISIFGIIALIILSKKRKTIEAPISS